MTDFEQQYRSDNFEKIARLDVSSAEDFKLDPVRALYNWWQGHSPARPKYAAFDISQHWSLAPYLYVIQLLEPGKFLYRLNGEKVVEIIGVSQRGQEFSTRDSVLENRVLAEYLTPIIEKGKPKRCTGTLESFGRRHIVFESVDCPLENNDGDVEFIIGAIATF